MVVRGGILLVGLGLLWQILVVTLDLPPYILPSPFLVLNSFVHNYLIILSNCVPTFLETLAGLGLGILLGGLLAIFMSWAPGVSYWLLPMVVVSQAIPTFALAPLLVLWLGYGLASKIFTVMLMLFFPVTSAFYEGLKDTKSEWLDMAKTMAGTQFGILWNLRLPAALPNFATGIRVATALAPIGAIISEWVGASKGLGFLMLNANARLDIPLMFACIIAIMMWSLFLYTVMTTLLRKMITW